MHTDGMDLAERVAFVTGTASPQGLGAGIARSLAEAGATVYCISRSSSEIVTASLPTPLGQQHADRPADVTDRAAIESIMDEIVDRHGRLDVVVNNAGIFERRPVDEETDESFRSQFEVNTYAVFVATRKAAQLMKKQDAGRIINIASQLGKIGRHSLSIYAASKGAVILFSQSVALELAPFGITVNCICPGTMYTKLLTTADAQPADEYAARLGVDVDTAFEALIAAKIPVGRLGRPEDVGAASAWLASDRASFVTGAALNVTGGEQIFF